MIGGIGIPGCLDSYTKPLKFPGFERGAAAEETPYPYTRFERDICFFLGVFLPRSFLFVVCYRCFGCLCIKRFDLLLSDLKDKKYPAVRLNTYNVLSLKPALTNNVQCISVSFDNSNYIQTFSHIAVNFVYFLCNDNLR